jgi:signal transduction histidine kinase
VDPGRPIRRRIARALDEGPLGGFHVRLILPAVLMMVLRQAVFLLILHMEGGPGSVRRHKMASRLQTMIAEPLRGRPAAAEPFLACHDRLGPQIWLESPQGRVIAGTSVEGLGFCGRRSLGRPEELAAPPGEAGALPEGILLWRARTDWETGPDSPLEVMEVPVALKEGPGRLLFTYWSGGLAWRGRRFHLGSLAMAVPAPALSWVLARRLAKPLANLRRGVLAMDARSPGRSVPVEGPREVADVAGSINALAWSLDQRDRRPRELMGSVSHEPRSPLTRLDFALTFMGRGLVRARRRLELAEAMGLKAPDDWHLDAADEDEAEKSVPDGVPADGLGLGDPPTPLDLGLKRHRIHRREIGRMDDLIGAALLVNRLDLGYASKSPGRLDLSAMRLESAELFRPIFEAREMETRASLERGPALFGERALIERLLGNILDNAAKYTRPRGLVPMSAGRSGSGRIRLELGNSSEPLGGQRLSGLFEPFYRAGGSCVGSGLGLSLAKRIVVIHGGAITADSTDWSFRLSMDRPSADVAGAVGR